MHYIGMFAVEIPGRVTWQIDLVLASIAFGMILGALAMGVATRSCSRRNAALAAVLLTLAIVSHHFTAMGAVEIVPDPDARHRRAVVVAAGCWRRRSRAGRWRFWASAWPAPSPAAGSTRSSSFLSMALNNLSQGVVIFMDERLVFCNERFLTLYGLPGDIIKPGCTLTDIFRIRAAGNTFKHDPETYRKDLLAAMTAGKTTASVVGTPDGREISVVNRPIPGGPYWIGSHEDITEQLRVERERASLDEQRDRRASIEVAIAAFRDTIATVLNTLSDSTATLRSTSTVLSSASGQTASQAAGAVNSSTDASANVGAAAAGAEQLLASIS